MTEDYLRNYLILGIKPGASWKQLRQAYKKLVNAWHPDRFQQNARQKKLAEEKTKEITQSYKELAEYYKKFGVLPLPPEEHQPPASAESGRHVTSAEYVPPDIKTQEPAPATSSAGAPKFRISKRRARILAAMALLGSVYLIWQITPWERGDDAPLSKEFDGQPSDSRNRADSAKAAPVEKHFAVGSSPGEVYAIQGVPTKTDHDIWYYGSSKVYFAKGKVQHWKESPDNPLQVNIKPETEKMNAEFFGKGSSKKEVLAVQGAPDRDAGSVWDYGVSRVYFDNDRVKNWDESPLYPLRVRR
jgi:hypothetical protein